MNKERAFHILRRYPGIMAFVEQPRESPPPNPPEVCLAGWFSIEAIQAMAWWMQHCPTESWWDHKPSRDQKPNSWGGLTSETLA